ncbi:MAG: hypothetical protein JXD21_08660 [Candidatus Omnitrophica bacterium]|nr:hypothetical protein [Candidatus Omnitrophota bacterium]
MPIHNLGSEDEHHPAGDEPPSLCEMISKIKIERKYSLDFFTKKLSG